MHIENMSVKIDWDRIITDVILYIITPSAIVVGSGILSLIQTGTFIKYLVEYWYLIVIVIIVVMLIAYILFRRKSDDFPIGMAFSINQDYWEPVIRIEHAGLLWDIYKEKNIFLDSFNQNRTISPNTAVNTPPRCPKCKTEINEDVGFFGGSRFSCPNCGFHVLNKKSLYLLKQDVEKIGKRKVELLMFGK